MKNIRTATFQDMTYNGKYGFKINETCQLKVSKNKIVITKTIKDDTGKKTITSKRNEAKKMERP